MYYWYKREWDKIMKIIMSVYYYFNIEYILIGRFLTKLF